MFSKDSDKRFVLIEKNLGEKFSVSIIVDKQTGVHYITVGMGPDTPGGITPLLNENGEVYIDKSIFDEKE